MLPGGAHVVAACADGTLSLLDLRKSGAVASFVACGTPLRCSASDGATAVGGGESGAVVFWDVAQQLGHAPAAGPIMHPELDGLYAPLEAQPPSAVNALAWAARMPGGPGGGGGDALCLATGHEGGVLRLYWAPQ